jgi:hypothetical protein
MAGPFRPASPAEDLPDYYNNLGDENIQHCFRNFDDERNFDLFDRQTRNPNSTNFCIDFGEDDAFCAFDLDAQSYSKLLKTPRPQDLHTRWINIWMPYNQKDLIKVVGQHFDFTPRLLGMMSSDPCPPRVQSLRKGKSSSTLRSRFSGKSEAREKRVNQTSQDSESSIGMTELMHSTQLEMVQDLSHYQLVNDVWHWSTVDWGRRCEFVSERCGKDMLIVMQLCVWAIIPYITSARNPEKTMTMTRQTDLETFLMVSVSGTGFSCAKTRQSSLSRRIRIHLATANCELRTSRCSTRLEGISSTCSGSCRKHQLH